MAGLTKSRLLYHILRRQPLNISRCCSKRTHDVWDVRYEDPKDGPVRYHERNANEDERDNVTALTLFFQRDINISFKAMKRFIQRVKDVSIKSVQSYNPERVQILGPELSAAHVVLQLGGAVKFLGQEKWNRKDDKGYSLPKKYVPNVYVECIDASKTPLTTIGLESIETVKCLKWLSVEGCQCVDDWFLDRLGYFRDSLEYLDISGCANVTERGVAVLHRLRKLKTLKLADLPGFQNAEIVCILLEELLPECKIEGVDYMNDIALSEAVKDELQKE